MGYRPARIPPPDPGKTLPETPKKKPAAAQKISPRSEKIPKHGWCPECEYGYKVLGRINPDGGHPNAGQRKFSCSNRTERGCQFLEIIPAGAFIETANTTPMRMGGCPQCLLGHLVETTQSPWNFRIRKMVCDRKKAKERPCDYEREIPKAKYTPKLVGNVGQPTKHHVSGHPVLGPPSSPITKLSIGKSSPVGRPSSSRRSSPIWMTRPLRQPAPVIDSTPSPSPPPSPSPNPSPSHDPVDMDAEEDIYFQDSPKVHGPPPGGQSSEGVGLTGPQEAPRISDPQEGETHNFSFTSPSKITSTRDSTDANVFGQPVMGKPTHNSQAKNPVASTTQWLRRGPLTDSRQDQKAIAAAPARSTAAVTAGLSNPVDVIDLTENDAPPRTPPRPPKTFYPTPDTSIKTKGKAKTPVAVEGEGCDEFDFGLDDKDLLEFAEQVDKCVPARARSQSTDYGSFDEDDTEDLIRITDEAAAKVPLTPTGNKLPASAAQLWTPSKTPTRAPASAPAKREVAGPGPSTRATAKTRAPVVSAARTQFQKPPAFKANKMNKAGHTVIEIDRGLTLGGSSIEG